MSVEAMTPQEERLMLLRRGTKAFDLPPSALVATAERDLRRRDRNAEIRAARNESPDSWAWEATIERYAFLAAHLKGCETPADALSKAIKGIEHGAASSTWARALLYQDKEKLEAAHKLAMERAGQ